MPTRLARNAEIAIDDKNSFWRGVVWRMGILSMRPGLEKITDRPVYRSSVKRKDSCSLVSLRTGKTGRDGGDKELKVGYIAPQNNAACASP